MVKKSSVWYQQGLPISLTFITFLLLCAVFVGYIKTVNLLPGKNFSLHFRVQDILIGITIYVKTAIDFALFIGNLMTKNSGVRNRIAIEIGTQIGNAFGTLLILTMWYFFKEVPLLLALMIFLAAIVLFAMAEESINELLENKRSKIIETIAKAVQKPLQVVNKIFLPINRIILPRENENKMVKKTFFALLGFSVLIPFILGLDDFAGYIPLFSLVNVFGFCIGVFFAHMLLLTFLFISPNKTGNMVRHPFIMLGGSIAFIGIAVYGVFETIKILVTIL